MSELPQGYRDIPEEDRRKAQKFFERGKTVAGTGNYEYAIEMFLQGLAVDPEKNNHASGFGDMMVGRVSAGSAARRGEAMLLAVDASRIHLFDPDTGEAIIKSSAGS